MCMLLDALHLCGQGMHTAMSIADAIALPVRALAAGAPETAGSQGAAAAAGLPPAAQWHGLQAAFQVGEVPCM
jgi:hypothetical protein